jgi:uncharacterized membrane protein YphA (DoxX/SURF4 family)
MMYLFVLGRVLLGGYFILAGLNHFKNLNMMAGYAQSKGVPMAREAVLLTGLMLLLGGLGVLLGIYIELSVLLLSVFLLVTTFQMHQFWNVSEPMARMGEEINFKKNLALLGAVLMLLAIPMSTWVLPFMM